MNLTAATPSGSPRPLTNECSAAIGSINAGDLKKTVRSQAFSRHVNEKAANSNAGVIIYDEFARLGFAVNLQGSVGNVVAGDPQSARVLIGAHFDSVRGTPGADDNASAVAVMLAVANALGPSRRDVCFVAFNAEEDGLRGSAEFVDRLGSNSRMEQVHVLEMVGYTSTRPGSQKNPLGPMLGNFPDRGDFLGLLADHRAASTAGRILTLAGDHLPGFPVWGLLLPDMPLDRLPGVLFRSDHVPFWRKGIPAMMWTDTAEYRNPNYHLPTDTPETLDYGFMVNVARLLVLWTMR